jgi:hypothetical protein
MSTIKLAAAQKLTPADRKCETVWRELGLQSVTGRGPPWQRVSPLRGTYRTPATFAQMHLFMACCSLLAVLFSLPHSLPHPLLPLPSRPSPTELCLDTDVMSVVCRAAGSVQGQPHPLHTPSHTQNPAASHHNVPLNTSFLLLHTCRVFSACAELCLDMDVMCAFWAQQGQCKANPTYMVGDKTHVGHCKASCKTCSPSECLYCLAWFLFT